jgi:hypothetical protein
MPRAWLVLRASRDPNRRVFRRSQILALGTALLAHLPAGFISATASCARAEELRRTHFDLVFHGRPAYPCGPAWPQTRRFCASFVPAHRPTLRFFRDILVPTTGVCESCSLSGHRPPNGSCALRPEQLQVYRSNNFCASPSRSATWHIYPLPRAIDPTRKPLGHLPSPEDGPRTPTGQSLASEMPPSELSWRAVPRY